MSSPHLVRYTKLPSIEPSWFPSLERSYYRIDILIPEADMVKRNLWPTKLSSASMITIGSGTREVATTHLKSVTMKSNQTMKKTALQHFEIEKSLDYDAVNMAKPTLQTPLNV